MIKEKRKKKKKNITRKAKKCRIKTIADKLKERKKRERQK